MSSTNRATGRSVPRANPEEMMWTGVRPKQQPPVLDQAKIAELQRNSVPSQPEATVTFSRHGDPRAANMGIQQNQGQNLSSLSAIVRDEPNFPHPVHLQKHMSMNTADKYHHIKFATIEGSGETLPDRRST